MSGYLDLFKTLQVSTIIRDISKKIITIQELEYPSSIQVYFKDRNPASLPFSGDYSQDPDPIKHMKDLLNGLYLLEQVFKKLEDIPDRTVASILGIQGLLEQAFQASGYLTQSGVNILSTFKDEFGHASQAFEVLQQLFNTKFLAASQEKKTSGHARNVGKVIGYAVSQMSSQEGALDFDLLSAVTTNIPHYIEACRKEIESHKPSVKKGAPNVNYEKIDAFTARSEELAETLKNCKDWLSFFANAFSLLIQVSRLMNDVLSELGELDSSVQRLILEHLAKLKYEVFPQLFAMIDKAELKLMCRPGRLSKPMMSQIKPLYQMVIDNSRRYINYQGKAEKLLKLEDERFLECRMEHMANEIRESTLMVQCIDKALEMLDSCFEILNDENQTSLSSSLQAQFKLLKPCLLLIDSSFQDKLLMVDPSWIAYFYDTVYGTETYSTIDKTKTNLSELRATLTQMRATQHFKIERHERMRTSIRQQTRMTLLPQTASENKLSIRDADVLRRRHLLRGDLPISSEGEVTNLAQLTPAERWDLCTAYRERLNEIEQAERCLGGLAALCEAESELGNTSRVFKESQFKVQRPEYQILLNKEKTKFNPNLIQIKINKQLLNYDLQRECLDDGGKLYLTSLQEAQKLDRRDCYVLERDKHKLHHIAADGTIERNIPHKILGETLQDIEIPEQIFNKKVEKKVGENIFNVFKVLFKDRRQLRYNYGQQSIDEKEDHSISLWLAGESICYETRVPSNQDCTVHFSSLEAAQRRHRWGCYVWDRESATMSYIAPDGRVTSNIEYDHELWQQYLDGFVFRERFLTNIQVSRQDIEAIITNSGGHVPMKIHRGEIPLSEFNQPIFTLPDGEVRTILLKITNAEALSEDEQQRFAALTLDDIEALLPNISAKLLERSHIGKGPERKQQIVDHKRSMSNPDAVYFKINNGFLYYNARTKRKEGCNLYFMSLDEARRAGHVGCYVWNRYYKQMDYIAPDGRIQRNIHYNDGLLKAYLAFVRKRDPNTNVRYLTPEQINRFISESGDHYPVDVYEGCLSLNQVGCTLKSLEDVEQLNPYLDCIFAELYERGHIEDLSRANVINSYANIQPFMASVEVLDESSEEFDRSVVHALMGGRDRVEPTQEVTAISLNTAKDRFSAVKEQIHRQKEPLAQKLDRLEQGMSYSAVVLDTPMVSLADESAIATEVADFLDSAAPLERKISEAQKIILKLDIALDRVDLTSQARKQLEQQKVRHLYVLFHHQQLLSEFRQCHSELDYAIGNEKLKTALLYHAPHYKIRLMSEEDPGDRHIQIAIEGGNLHYKLRYYGELTQGTISLEAIKPPLESFSQDTILNSQTYASIVDNIYHNRAIQIASNTDVLLADEAIDLFLWYEIQQQKIETTLSALTGWISAIQEINTPENCSNAIMTLYNNLRPVLMTMAACEHLKTFEQAFAYCKANDLSADMKQQQRVIIERREVYQSQVSRLRGSMTTDDILPADIPEPPLSDISRKNYLLKHRACSEGIASMERSMSELKVYLNPVLSSKIQMKAVLNKLPFPEVADTAQKLAEPHQLVAFKQIYNLLHYLKQSMIHLEKIHTGEMKIQQLRHVIEGYLETQNAIFLGLELMQDPYLQQFYESILKQSNKIYTKLVSDIEHYEPQESEYRSELPYLSQTLNALNELPTQIDSLRTTEQSSTRNPARNIAGATAKRIDKLTSRLQRSLQSQAAIHQFFQPWVTLEDSSEKNWSVSVLRGIEDISLAFAKLPIWFETVEVASLLSELKDKVKLLTHAAHGRVTSDLKIIHEQDIKKILLKIDELEDKWGLQPGLLATPSRNLLEQFYLGMITPLIPVQDSISLIAKHGTVYKSRISAAKQRMSIMVEKKAQALQTISAIDNLHKKHADTQRYSLTNLVWGASYDHVYESYQALLPSIEQALTSNDKASHFPYLRHRLNGCELFFMSTGEAERENKTDCLIWFYTSTRPPTPKLIYISPDGIQYEPIKLKNTYKFVAAIEKKSQIAMEERVQGQARQTRSSVSFSDAEIKDLIVENHYHAVPSNPLPLKISDETIGALKTLSSKPNTIEEQRTFDNNFKKLLPLLKHCQCYYQGIVSTAQTAVEVSRSQIRYLKYEKQQQLERNRVLARSIYEDYYDKHIKKCREIMNNFFR